MIKMIANCRGCIEEFWQALEYQDQGLHLATTKEYVGIGERKHFFLTMVDDDGGVMVE